MMQYTKDNTGMDSFEKKRSIAWFPDPDKVGQGWKKLQADFLGP